MTRHEVFIHHDIVRLLVRLHNLSVSVFRIGKNFRLPAVLDLDFDLDLVFVLVQVPALVLVLTNDYFFRIDFLPLCTTIVDF